MLRYNPSTTEPKLQKQVLWRMSFKKNAFHPKKKQKQSLQLNNKNNNQKPTRKIRINSWKIAEKI